MQEQENKRNHRTGLIISLGIHGALLLLFIFLLAWSPPDPPIQEYGIELNFGFDESGSGEVETEEVSEVESEAESDNETESEIETEPIEEIIEEQSEEPIEEIVEESISPDYNDSASPDKVKESEETIVKKEEVKEEKKSPEKPVEKPKPLITYPSGGGKQGEGNTNEKGNQGDPRGDDGISYKGNPGSGGASLEMSGWRWDKKPIPNDPTEATGKIIFEIEVDKYGTVVSIKTLEKTVSPLVEKIYRDEVLKTSFSKTSAGAAAAERSLGKITFVIRSN
ncbi:MAG: hypothetical protein RH860_06920 [Cytophagales bacterium]